MTSKRRADKNKIDLHINDKLANEEKEKLKIENEITEVKKEIAQVNKRIADLEYVIGLIPLGSTKVPEDIVKTHTDGVVLLLCKYNEASLLDQLTNLQDQLTEAKKRLTSAVLSRDKLSTGLTSPTTLSTKSTGEFISVYFTISYITNLFCLFLCQ